VGAIRTRIIFGITGSIGYISRKIIGNRQFETIAKLVEATEEFLKSLNQRRVEILSAINCSGYVFTNARAVGPAAEIPITSTVAICSVLSRAAIASAAAWAVLPTSDGVLT